MKLNTDGVTIAILILIFMILICHTMNYLYPRKQMTQNKTLNNKLNNKLKPLINNKKNSINTFINTSNAIDYNKIYYHNQNEQKLCDANLDKQAHVPCNIIKKCSDDEALDDEALDEYTLSDSELAVLYKVAYEAAAREIFMRTLRENSIE